AFRRRAQAGPQSRQPGRVRPRSRAIDARVPRCRARLDTWRSNVMELTETYTLPVPQQRAWDALNDTEILRASIPGCDSIEPDGDNAYAVALSASVGPVKARFKGRMELTDIDAPNTYTIVFEGQGGAAGFGKGQTHVKLEPDGDD